MAVAQRLDRGLDDDVGRAEIGLADAEIDDVAALRGERVGARQHREGILLADAVEGRDGLQHGVPPCSTLPLPRGLGRPLMRGSRFGDIQRTACTRERRVAGRATNVTHWLPCAGGLERILAVKSNGSAVAEAPGRTIMAKKKTIRPEEAPKTPHPQGQQAALAALVRQSGQPRHDGALSRALSQLRPHRRRSCAPASRSSASRRPARTSRPATAITSSWPSACATASATPAASRSSFPCHPIQETGKRPTAALDRNLAYLSLVEVLYGYPLDGVVLTDRLRQDHAGLHHGGGDREHPGDRALRRADAQRLVEGRARRLRHRGLEGARGAGRRPHRRPGVHRHRRRVGAVGRPLQHHGHRLDHERARRGARHVAARLRRDPGALPRARADRLRDRRARGRDRARGPASRPTSSPARRSRTPSSPTRRSAARPTRRSTSTPSRAISA